MEITKKQILIITASFFLISCITSGEVKIQKEREPSSVMVLTQEDALKFSKGWINIPQGELANTNLSLERGSYSGAGDFVFNIALEKDNIVLPDTPGGSRLHLTMFIDDSVHNHRLGNHMASIIHKAAWIWENSVGEDVFTIYDRYDSSLLEGEQLPATHFIWETLGNFAIDIGKKTLVHDDDEQTESRDDNVPKFDGISKIYYVQDNSKVAWSPYGYLGAAYPAYDLEWGVLVKSFTANKRVMEADIVMNGEGLEDPSNCFYVESEENLSNFLKSMNLNDNLDKCILNRFMETMLHEMGHVLMLRHNDQNENSIMNNRTLESYLNNIRYYDEGKLYQVDVDAYRESHVLFNSPF